MYAATACPCSESRLGQVPRGGHGEGVDDAGAGQPVQLLAEPRRALGGLVDLDHRQPQRLAFEAAAQHQRLGAADPELRGDVGDDPVVRGRGGGQHRDALAELADQGADPPVVGPEVVAPVGDAVRLVDHDEAGVGGERGQHLVAEVGIVQPLGADQQHVDVAVGDLRRGSRPTR